MRQLGGKDVSALNRKFTVFKLCIHLRPQLNIVNPAANGAVHINFGGSIQWQELNNRLQDKLGNLQELVLQTWSLHRDPVHAVIKIAGRRGVLDRFSARLRFPGTVFFRELANDEAIASLLDLSSDIGIVHTVPENFELIAKPLFKEEFQFVIPKHFVTKRPFFGESLCSELKMLPCLGYRPQDEIIKAACSLSSFELKSLRMIRATENYLSLAEMVDSRLGWAILPSYIGVSAAKNWIVPIPEKILPLRRFFMAYRKEFMLVPWFKSLTAEIRSSFELEKK